MKRLLLLLFPVLALGLGSCVDDGEKGDCIVTLVCLDADNLTAGALKSVEVKIPSGTYVDGDYLKGKNLIPEVEDYDYDSFHGPATKAEKGVSYSLYYKKTPPKEYRLVINYRDVAAENVPIADQKIIMVVEQTTINKEYLTEKEYIPAITGMAFKSLDPESQVLDGDKTVTVIYEKQKSGITIHYREKGKPESVLAEDMVLGDVLYGTVVNKAFLDGKEAVKTIDHYTYSSVEPTELTVTGDGEMTVWYTKKGYSVRLRFKNVDGNGDIPDPDNPGFNIMPQDVNISSGTTVNENYLRSAGYLKDIYGWEFVDINPPSAVIGEGSTIIDIRYQQLSGSLKLEYWKGAPGAGATLQESESHTLAVGTVVADYAWLQAQTLINAAFIPAGHHFHSMSPAANVKVEEGETTIKLYYEPDGISVKFTYWKGKRGAVGTAIEATDTRSIPYGTVVADYQQLWDGGYIDDAKLPANHIFDEMNPATFTVMDAMEVDIYYKSDQIPVKFTYYDGPRGEVGTAIHETDTRNMTYGTSVTGYDFLYDGGYIDDAKIPAGGTFLSMNPATFVVKNEGEEIGIYYVTYYTVTVKYRGITDSVEDPATEIFEDRTFDDIRKRTKIDAAWLGGKVDGYQTPPEGEWTGFDRVDGFVDALSGNITLTVWYTQPAPDPEP